MLNKAIALLKNNQPVFCGIIVTNGDYAQCRAAAMSSFDMVIIEMEHSGFDLPTLRHSLQYFLNRKRIAESGSVQADPVPVVRIPPYGRERNEWVIKQTLDQGAYGLVLPHIDSVEAAVHAVRASRYPAAKTATDREPEGERGWYPFEAMNYWGVGPEEYFDAADVWPLDPDGELLLMAIIENVRGVRAARDILREAKGIGAVWVGAGDLSVSLGYPGQIAHPEVAAAELEVLAACKEYDVPCGALVFDEEDAARRLEQGFRILLMNVGNLPALERARKACGRG